MTRCGRESPGGEQRGHAALQASDGFAQIEARRWEQVQALTLPPIVVTPEDAMHDLIQEGYVALEAGQTRDACDRWQPAWDLVKRLAQPTIRTTTAFDRVYSDMLQDVETATPRLRPQSGGGAKAWTQRALLVREWEKVQT